MSKPVYPLQLKPDLAEAARRWEAYCAGDIIDRPVVEVTAPVRPDGPRYARNYRENVYGDLEQILDRALAAAENTYYGGEALPSFYPCFGPDIIAVFCGAELRWNDASSETNWSVPCVARWEDALPLRLQEDHPLWQRQLAFYRLAAEKLEGKMLLRGLDWHTNMDLLSALRGPDRLSLDLIEQPGMIDAAMRSARALFAPLWQTIAEAGKMHERGFYNGLYSMEGADILQCDFGALISPAMFERWAVPALEEEAALVKHVYYHWDGPTQLVHEDLLCHLSGLHTLQYQMGDGGGRPADYLELYQRLQAKGKAIHFWGSIDEVKAAHLMLRPEKVLYSTWAGSPQAADELLQWFVNHT